GTWGRAAGGVGGVARGRRAVVPTGAGCCSWVGRRSALGGVMVCAPLGRHLGSACRGDGGSGWERRSPTWPGCCSWVGRRSALGGVVGRAGVGGRLGSARRGYGAPGWGAREPT